MLGFQLVAQIPVLKKLPTQEFVTHLMDSETKEISLKQVEFIMATDSLETIDILFKIKGQADSYVMKIDSHMIDLKYSSDVDEIILIIHHTINENQYESHRRMYKVKSSFIEETYDVHMIKLNDATMIVHQKRNWHTLKNNEIVFKLMNKVISK